jgi:hypothetical protein
LLASRCRWSCPGGNAITQICSPVWGSSPNLTYPNFINYGWHLCSWHLSLRLRRRRDSIWPSELELCLKLWRDTFWKLSWDPHFCDYIITLISIQCWGHCPWLIRHVCPCLVGSNHWFQPWKCYNFSPAHFWAMVKREILSEIMIAIELRSRTFEFCLIHEVGPNSRQVRAIFAL